jgi:importin subunit alpha-1
LKPLCEFLQRDTAKDHKLLLVILDALDNVLTVGTSDPLGGDEREYADLLDEYGGVDAIDLLQRHDNDSVYLRAKSIIDKFFGGTQVEDEGQDVDVDADLGSAQPQPMIPQGGFSF